MGCSAGAGPANGEQFCSVLDEYKALYLSGIQAVSDPLVRAEVLSSEDGIAARQEMWSLLAEAAPDSIRGGVENVRDDWLNQRARASDDAGGSVETAVDTYWAERVDVFVRGRCDGSYSIEAGFEYLGSDPEAGGEDDGVEETQTSAPNGPYSLETVIVHTADRSDGTSFTVELSLGPAIPWKDTEASQDAWASVGGTGTPPCIVSNPAYVGNGFLPDRSAHAYGTIRIVNNVVDFAPRNVRVNFAPPSRLDGAAFGYVTGSSSSGRCVAMFGGDALRPEIRDGQAVWGPVPIQIAVGDYFSANFPEGNPAKLGPFALVIGNDAVESFSLVR